MELVAYGRCLRGSIDTVDFPFSEVFFIFCKLVAEKTAVIRVNLWALFVKDIFVAFKNS
jgi:hypothetical protein